MLTSPLIERLMICPVCGAQLPVINKEGKHNFCPTSLHGGKVVDVCMDCKMGKVQIGAGVMWRSSIEDIGHKDDKSVMACALCSVKLPVFNSAGKHNFCPASFEGGKIVDVCIDCKVVMRRTRSGMGAVY